MAKYVGQKSPLISGSTALSNLGIPAYQPNQTDAQVVVRINTNWIHHLDGRIRELLERMGDEMVEDAQTRVPVFTGELQDSITYFIEGRGVHSHMYFGATAPYAMFVEFGHHTLSGSWVPAQPFLRPALYKVRNAGGNVPFRIAP